MRINLLDIIPGGMEELLRRKEFEMEIRRDSIEMILRQYLQEAEAQRMRVSVLCVIVSVLIVLGYAFFSLKGIVERT